MVRTKLKQTVSAISADQKTAYSSIIAEQLFSLPEWTAAQEVFCYLSLPYEVATQAVVDTAIAQRKHVYVPRVVGAEMEFCPLLDIADCTIGTFGIMCPSTPVTAISPDIIIVPMVGYDEHCGRLGHGGGYYDKALSRMTSSLRVGLAFSAQRVQSVYAEAFDIPMDIIITEQGIIRRQL